MSGERKPPTKIKSNGRLNDLLDFGPDSPPVTAASSHGISRRIKDLMKRLKEINDRIDNLTNRS